ncbi:alpha-galactosidase [Jeotgalibacillus alimentarius]|uniref:Alpha-galactosidase n=1 Tax=Jeotgalibacillus alimentarius TaxID=135826 RepID=A0A0C2V4Q1_9BACL|nr:alpha-galactosidase [Jeotgalibacillus alimentarius]KIL43992.1 alpha-galactosidase [Jeotgalibacillus alimentarius]
MPIYTCDTQFHLQGKDVSYIIRILENGQLEQTYFGKKVKDRPSFEGLAPMPNEPLGNANFPIENSGFTLEWARQEHPTYGTSDFREPAIEIEESQGSKLSHFVYESYKVTAGKPGITGMPSVYGSDEECETLQITLKDDILEAELNLFYTVFHHQNVILRHSEINNNGTKAFSINRMMSASIDLPDHDYESIQLDGAWIRERHIHRSPVKPGVHVVDSKKGVSSSWHQPFLALARPQTTEHQGEVIALNLIYSGNFRGSIEVDTYESTRLMMGLNPFDFKWLLAAGDTFSTPEAVLVYSDQGLNGMSHSFHNLYHHHLLRGVWKQKERPVLLNNWEATYFDFDHQKIIDIADSASELGVELFVLDDGWFEGRNNDTTSLGDWTADRRKLPEGLKGLADDVRASGTSFGIWVEPEMVSEKSRLYEKHPDWVLRAPHRPHTPGRNQMILDLGKKEVQNYIIEAIRHVLDESGASYVKWDMNRTVTEAYSDALPADRQGEVMLRYVLGLYRVLEEITSRYPDVLFESCASGGNRFDPGMLYYMPQTWTSDNTDAVERLKIQYGTSLVYPISSMGAHVSASPNHQTGRITPIDFRFHVAMFGAFGYELDPQDMDSDTRKILKDQITLFKKERKLLQFGRFYRLLSPFEGSDTAWMTVSEDQTEAIIAFYRVLSQPNAGMKRIRLSGLDPEKVYGVEWQEGSTLQNRHYGGDELMNIGWQIPPFFTGTVKMEHTHFYGDFQSAVWKLTEVKEG